jgi:hypothetical protein
MVSKCKWLLVFFSALKILARYDLQQFSYVTNMCRSYSTYVSERKQL